MIIRKDVLHFQAEYLRDFWAGFGVKRGVSREEWHDTIAALQRAGEIVLVYKNAKETKEKRREKFDKVKNLRRRYRFLGGEKCFACGGQPHVRHHIIWIKNGGRNSRKNICFLCHDCHAQVHPWLQDKLKVSSKCTKQFNK